MPIWVRIGREGFSVRVGVDEGGTTAVVVTGFGCRPSEEGSGADGEDVGAMTGEEVVGLPGCDVVRFLNNAVSLEGGVVPSEVPGLPAEDFLPILIPGIWNPLPLLASFSLSFSLVGGSSIPTEYRGGGLRPLVFSFPFPLPRVLETKEEPKIESLSWDLPLTVPPASRDLLAL